MIAVDTNILVYAHRRDSTFHRVARATMVELAEGHAPWAIPWPCVHEFLSIVTSARVFKNPTPPGEARAQIEAWIGSPSLRLLAEENGYWPVLARVLDSARVIGAKVHDARIAALAICHGVTRLFTADRDFSRFPELTTHNPL